MTLGGNPQATARGLSFGAPSCNVLIPHPPSKYDEASIKREEGGVSALSANVIIASGAAASSSDSRDAVRDLADGSLK